MLYRLTTAHVSSSQAQQAAKDGKFVVPPAWLTACKFAWARVPEADFPLTRPQGPIPAGSGSGGAARRAAAAAAAARGSGTGGDSDLAIALKGAGRAG